MKEHKLKDVIKLPMKERAGPTEDVVGVVK